MQGAVCEWGWGGSTRRRDKTRSERLREAEAPSWPLPQQHPGFKEALAGQRSQAAESC